MDQEPKKSNNKNRHVQWDEDKLNQTQKYRGTFQKITQPKTPYRGNSDEQMEQMEDLQKTEEQVQVEESLKQAQKNKQTNKHGKIDLETLNAQLKLQMAKYKEEGGEQMEQQVQTEEARKKKEEFKKKRAAHYNQFKLIQQARNNKWESDEDDQ